MHLIDYLIVSGYLLLTLFVGIRQGRKVKDMNDYAVGDYTFSRSVLFATIAATTIGGGATIGAAEKVFSIGIAYVIIWLGQPVFQVIISEFITPRMGHFKGMLSVAEIMGSFYGKSGRLLTGFMSTVYGAGLLSAQIYALGHMGSYFFGISEAWAIIIGAGIVVAYSTLGGIRSVTITDVIQFAVLIVTIPLVCAAGLGKVGGFESLFQAVPAERLTIINDDLLKNIGIFLVFAIPFMDPTVTQRLLMAKDWRQAQASFRWCAGISFPFFIMIGIIGFVSFALKPDINPNLALPYLISDILPMGFRGFAIAGMIAVIMSTADSCLNAASVSFVHDVVKTQIKKPMSTRKELAFAKLATLIMGVVSILVSLISTSVTNILLATLSLWGGVVLMPLMAGIFGYVASVRTFWFTVITGVVSYLLWEEYLEPFVRLSALIPSIVAASFVFFMLRKFVDKVSKVEEEKTIIKHERALGKLSLSRRIDLFTQKVMARKAPYMFFASFMILDNIMPYLLWAGEATQHDLSLTLRIISSLLCLGVLVRDSWLTSVRHKVAWLYGTLLFSLPFLSSYLLISSNMKPLWIVNAVISFLVLMFMVDWKSFLALSVVGIISGLAFFTITTESPIQMTFTTDTIWLLGYTCTLSLLIGAVFAQKMERLQEKRLADMKMMAGAIAHEIRTPLSIINMKGSLMDKAMQDQDHPLSMLPKEIMKVANQAQAVIDMTLAKFSQVDEEQLCTISLNDTISKALETYVFEDNQSKRVTWSRGEDAYVMAQEQLMIQVIYNLLKNALYFTEVNQGHVSLTTEIDAQNVSLIVNDTGPGIPSNRLEKVFTPFYSKRSGGTGIGLAFCRNTIESFGGTITCHSVEGKSTTFIINLPVAKRQERAA